MHYSLLFVLICGVIGQPVLTGYQYSVDLSGNLNIPSYYRFYYSVVGQYLRAGVVAYTNPTGWVGIGFSQSGLMVTSDAVLGWVDGAGVGFVTDFYLNGRNAPSPVVCSGTTLAACADTARTRLNCGNDLYNTTIQRSGDFLQFEFTRPLAATDQCDLAINPNVSMYLVFSYGPVTSSGTWPNKIQFHESRTNGSYNIILAPYVPPATTTVQTTGQVTTGVSTTGSSTTTGVMPVPPPTLTGYDYSIDLTGSLTDSFTPVNTYAKLYYKIVGNLASFGIVSQSDYNGWFGLGFSYDGQMVPSMTGNNISDAIIGWITPGGVPQITDFEMRGRVAAAIDICSDGSIPAVCPDQARSCTDNLSQIRGSRTNQYMTLEFSRPVIAEDSCDVSITPNVPQYIVYALGPITQSGEWPYKIQFHEVHTNVTKLVTFIPRANATTATTATTATSSSASTQQATTTDCMIGKEGCPCTLGGACDNGLECRSRLCVSDATTSVISLFLIALILALTM